MQKNKVDEWVQLYLRHIREISIEKHVDVEEGYKFVAVEHFQKHFNIDSLDLAGNLEESLLLNNLVIGAQYFPRRMLILFAQMFPEEVRGILKNLFNDAVPVSQRITQTKNSFDDLNDKRNKAGYAAHNTYIGLRFISLLLGFKKPEKYNPLKPSEWKVFARYLNPNFGIPIHTPPGKQYEMYEDYIEALREFIKNREEITKIKEKLTENLLFKDTEYRWMTQNIIYVTARVFARAHSGELTSNKTVTGEGQVVDNAVDNSVENIEEDGTGFMPLEEHLEEYVVQNWNNIDFGEELALYRDEDGTPGQQYTTDVGIIDILAKDKNNNFVVIELKRAESGYKVVGQILNYMGWVKEKLAQKDQRVRGLIIVGRADHTLRSALIPVADKIALREYKIKMSLVFS